MDFPIGYILTATHFHLLLDAHGPARGASLCSQLWQACPPSLTAHWLPWCAAFRSSPWWILSALRSSLPSFHLSLSIRAFLRRVTMRTCKFCSAPLAVTFPFLLWHKHSVIGAAILQCLSWNDKSTHTDNGTESLTMKIIGRSDILPIGLADVFLFHDGEESDSSSQAICCPWSLLSPSCNCLVLHMAERLPGLSVIKW